MDERLKNIAENLDTLAIGPDEPFKFHCDMCGKCCINRDDILLNPRDIYNMSKELQMRPAEVFKAYCEAYIGDNSRMPIARIKPRGSIKRCPLLKDRKCSVHKAKPTVCAMFPLGRCVQMDAENPGSQPNGSIIYIFEDPGCGDASETHTVREWLNQFGLPLNDEFFIAWTHIIAELGQIFAKIEKILSKDKMAEIWNLTFVKVYLDYNTEQDFLPQFEKNAGDILSVMRMLLTGEQ